MTCIENRFQAPHSGRVLALCGGVGGAKLALGLEAILSAGQLDIVVNTGDDFDYLGLRISPDLDTILYTLSGWNDIQRGWGRSDETWNFMAALKQLGGESWFSLGDRDLALHVERTRRLREGETLTDFMNALAHRNGIKAKLLPMTDDVVSTIVHTTEGDLPFQHYFVKQQCQPVVTGISFTGAQDATPNPALMQALADPELTVVAICPSNPFLSIDPILSLPGVRAALQRTAAQVVVVSPIVGGQAVKGPTGKIMHELGLSANSLTIAEHYAGLIDGLIIDTCDAADAASLDIPTCVTRTLMSSTEDKRKLAQETLAFARSLHQTPGAKARLIRSA